MLGPARGVGPALGQQPTAPAAAVKKPVEELERDRVERDTLCPGAAGGVGSRHAASMDGGGREGILGSREERGQYDPEQKAFELAERAPESEGTMSGRDICL